MLNYNNLILLCLVVIFCNCISILNGEAIWVGPNGIGFYDVSSNWNPARVPDDSSFSIIFNTTGKCTVRTPITYTPQQIYIGSPSDPTVASQFVIDNGKILLSQLYLYSGSTFEMRNTTSLIQYTVDGGHMFIKGGKLILRKGVIAAIFIAEPDTIISFEPLSSTDNYVEVAQYAHEFNKTLIDITPGMNVTFDRGLIVTNSTFQVSSSFVYFKDINQPYKFINSRVSLESATIVSDKDVQFQDNSQIYIYDSTLTFSIMLSNGTSYSSFSNTRLTITDQLTAQSNSMLELEDSLLDYNQASSTFISVKDSSQVFLTNSRVSMKSGDSLDINDNVNLYLLGRSSCQGIINMYNSSSISFKNFTQSTPYSTTVNIVDSIGISFFNSTSNGLSFSFSTGSSGQLYVANGGNVEMTSQSFVNAHNLKSITVEKQGHLKISSQDFVFPSVGFYINGGSTVSIVRSQVTITPTITLSLQDSTISLLDQSTLLVNSAFVFNNTRLQLNSKSMVTLNFTTDFIRFINNNSIEIGEDSQLNVESPIKIEYWLNNNIVNYGVLNIVLSLFNCTKITNNGVVQLTSSPTTLNSQFLNLNGKFVSSNAENAAIVYLSSFVQGNGTLDITNTEIKTNGSVSIQSGGVICGKGIIQSPQLTSDSGQFGCKDITGNLIVTTESLEISSTSTLVIRITPTNSTLLSFPITIMELSKFNLVVYIDETLEGSESIRIIDYQSMTSGSLFSNVSVISYNTETGEETNCNSHTMTYNNEYTAFQLNQAGCPNRSSKLSGGAIAGIVIGIIVFCSGVVVIIVKSSKLKQMHHQMSKRKQELKRFKDLTTADTADNSANNK
ncbi:hypothetical protein DLAC_00139 [Tieghemostelium lacteum]|uniref:Transmembrane protein n=1 Tax=Tieghemostelium lacteum TaxID=361077 RepID=A0A152A8Y3_TIELA|nr:hypothetical protein DLAC_00139 [Tieghemostelium lacteum]|eukprot:KYR02680.1 hypothetical protein DLAC_00139 [Tieghemostelium lacteum]